MTKSEELILEIHKIVVDVDKKLSVNVSEVKQLRKEADIHRFELNELNNHKNNLIGKLSVLVLFIGLFCTWLGSWISKHF